MVNSVDLKSWGSFHSPEFGWKWGLREEREKLEKLHSFFDAFLVVQDLG